MKGEKKNKKTFWISFLVFLGGFSFLYRTFVSLRIFNSVELRSRATCPRVHSVKTSSRASGHERRVYPNSRRELMPLRETSETWGFSGVAHATPARNPNNKRISQYLAQPFPLSVIGSSCWCMRWKRYQKTDRRMRNLKRASKHPQKDHRRLSQEQLDWVGSDWLLLALCLCLLFFTIWV